MLLKQELSVPGRWCRKVVILEVPSCSIVCFRFLLQERLCRHQESGWSCCCLLRAWAQGTSLARLADICLHQHNPSSLPIRDHAGVSEDSPGHLRTTWSRAVAPKWRCTWWTVLFCAVAWRRVEGQCWWPDPESTEMWYRVTSVLAFLHVKHRRKCNCFINFPQLPHNRS